MARYAFTDLHGRLDIFNNICKFVKPEDELYCLGDCGDRGPQPWETIKAVLEHPQVKVYLKGNHEDMLIKAYIAHQKYGHGGYTNKYYLLCRNGGDKTFDEFMREGDKTEEWIAKLNNLPSLASIFNEKKDLVIMTHAGYTPGGLIPTEEDLLWDRSHFSDPWLEGFEHTVIVHGHTPVSFLKDEVEVDANLTYSDGHKIDLDTSAVTTGVAVLLNLDTYELHRIYGDEWELTYDE